MATNQTPARPPIMAQVLNYLLSLSVIVAMIGMIWLIAPIIYARYVGHAQEGPSSPIPAPPSSPARPAPIAPRADSPPALTLEQISATSTAIYHATAAAVDAPPNADITGDSAPLITEEKPAERQGAGANVPTAEPQAPAESDEQTGSKPVLINPQETHACRHAQVWTENGCKNPTPVQP